jgi:hypothetical protein
MSLLREARLHLLLMEILRLDREQTDRPAEVRTRVPEEKRSDACLAEVPEAESLTGHGVDLRVGEAVLDT